MHEAQLLSELFFPRRKANHHIFCLWQFLSLLISSLQLNKVSQENKVSFLTQNLGSGLNKLVYIHTQ